MVMVTNRFYFSTYLYFLLNFIIKLGHSGKKAGYEFCVLGNYNSHAPEPLILFRCPFLYVSKCGKKLALQPTPPCTVLHSNLEQMFEVEREKRKKMKWTSIRLN